jgi:selenocysteine-specific elongation factor
MRHFILATAGHVDHGKSSLVKTLTGADPDRLPEEKVRGITIDLGFAELNLNGPNGEIFHVGFIDVPGHEDFVRNMVAGVGSADAALLTVAADDGWMPQTEEHLQILLYLGVKRILVALTKADVAKIDNRRGEIQEKLRDTPFANAQIIPTSIRNDSGIEELKRALVSEFAELPPTRNIGKPRLFVDRAFSLHGIGTVATGTLVGGEIQRNQSVFIQPLGIPARIRSLQTHNRDLEVAQPQMRTAINIPDVPIAPDGIQRGHVVTSLPCETSSSIDAFLSRSSRLARGTPLKSGTSAYVHHGTARVLAKIIFAESNALAVGESAVAQLRLSAPLLAFVGDRFIVRDASELRTIAGGVVLNLDSTAFRSAQQCALLVSRAVAPDDVDLAVWTEIARGDVIEPSQLLTRSHFNSQEIANALQKLARNGEIFLNENIAVKMLVWREIRERAAKLIDANHKEHPERRGLELNELRTQLNSLAANVFDALIVDLCRAYFVCAGSTIARASHRASLPAKLESAAAKIRDALVAKPFDPSSRKEIAKDRQEEQALQFLVDQGEIVEVSSEIVLFRESLDQIKSIVSDFITANGPASASQLRERVGTSRRVIIPVLEYLDRVGVTQRVGDERVLAKKASVVKLDDAETARRT